MIKERLFVMVIVVMSLVACRPTQLVPTAPPPPAAYHGNPLPTPQPIAADEQVPPVWLIVQDKAVPGTLLGYRVFTGQNIETDGRETITSPATEAPARSGQQEIETDGQQPYGYVFYGHEPGQKTFTTDLEQVELASVSLAAGELVIIVAPTSVTALQARLVEVPLAAGGRSLKADGKTESDAAVFTLEPNAYPNARFLRVRLDFEGPLPGAVEYVWQLVNIGGRAPATPATVLSAEGPPPCVRPTPVPQTTPTPLPALAFHDGTGVLPPEILASWSDLVILGTVVGPAVGLELPWGGGEPGHLTIVTDTLVQVECVLKGPPTGATVTVRVAGGCVEREGGQTDCGAMISHIRPLEIGQRTVLFLRHEGPDYVTRRREDGTYETQTGPDYYARSGEFGVAGDRTSNGLDELPLAELMARLDSVHRPGSADAELARETLITFFDRLQAGRYQEAVELYGGSYQVLVEYNPDVDPQAHAALLERACTVNGYQCLRAFSVALQGQVSPTAYRFSVAFEDASGRLFILGAVEPAQGQFVFTVQKEGVGRFLVQELPVYVP